MNESEMPERYKMIYQELDIKMDPQLGNEEDKEDGNENGLDGLVAKLALFFSEKDDRIYNDFIKKYDYLRRETLNSYRKNSIKNAAHKAFMYATRRS